MPARPDLEFFIGLHRRPFDQQPTRGHDDAVVDHHEVQGLLVAPVALLGQADALLADEDLLAEDEGGGDLAVVPRRPDLDHVFKAYRFMSASSCARSRY